ncbi:MAG: SDR family NAD(P)-dependent oxidoreductase, partial [Acidobacteriota bacterium]|nr:SDR family NAD(P)-dependent oxidoreductase [Acidobacteriota bacterium]
RFPGAPTVEAFWANLRDGVESITFYTDEDLRRQGIDPAKLSDPNFVRARPYLDGQDLFDAGFFGYSAQDAETIDPQQRIFLEAAWEALEHAGYVPDRFDGLIGVFGGSSQNTYLWFNLLARPQFLQRTGVLRTVITNGADYLATRVAYKLNLTGPACTVQTACSTALVAVHLACQSLLNFECDLALAGASSLNVSPFAGYNYETGGLLSRDGHCRAFDARANGTLFGDGVGVVALKRLDEALADGDTVHTVILGSAVNNDGAGKAGFTAPAATGQAAVVFQALDNAGVPADTISYVEAHGTGTELGDPIEVKALTSAFRSSTAKKGFCALGSVKTNIGHLNAAAGIAGLVKTVLALTHRQIPPSLHFDTPNPAIDFANSPFVVNDRLRDWPAAATPRRAGVSAFGIGGTNAHVVLEEAPAAGPSGPSRDTQIVVLSARSEPALGRAAEQLDEHLRAHPGDRIADVAFTLTQGRRAFPHRLAVLGSDATGVRSGLAGVSGARRWSAAPRTVGRRVTFLLPGQGAQFVNMGRALYEKEAAFRDAFDRASAIVRAAEGLDLADIVYPAAGQEATARVRLRQTAATQTAVFAVSYALAQQWAAWGVRPAAMLGHSLGEYVAACLAGVMDLESALRLVALRGRLMQALPGGTMLAVALAEADARRYATDAVSLAAVNGPASCVLAGPTGAMRELEGALAAAGVAATALETSHAFHSSMMDPMLEAFGDAVSKVPLRAPSVPYVSNVSGRWVTPEEATAPEYWVRHVRETVRFGDGLATLLEDEERVLLEAGPGRTLAGLVRRHAAAGETLVVPTLQDGDATDALAGMQGALAALWTQGVDVDWSGYWAGERRRRVPLPTYPFERQRYWSDPFQAAPVTPAGGEPEAEAPVTRPRETTTGWFAAPVWRQSPADRLLASDRSGAGPRWLVLADDQGLGAALVDRLTAAGADVVKVTIGGRFAPLGPRACALDPSRPDDWAALVAHLRAEGLMPDRVAHLWTVTARDVPISDPSVLQRLQRHGFDSLVLMLQAFGEGAADCPFRLGVVTSHTHEIAGGDGRFPEKATVLGPVRVIRAERPAIRAVAIDVEAPVGTGGWGPVAGQVVDEFDLDADDDLVAYRGGRRWTQAFEPVSLDVRPGGSDVPAGLRPGGTYLITGGLGGVGLSLARWLAASLQPKLVLTSRRGLLPRDQWDGWMAAHPGDPRAAQMTAVRELEAAGAEVLVAGVDVTDGTAMRDLLDRAVRRFGPLAGVIHAAGVAGGGVIQLKTLDAAHDVLAPKLRGTRVLDVVLKRHTPDFVVLCSSVAALTGGAGQVDYCAANAYLDAYAQARAADPLTRVVAIDWDAWRDVGMAAGTPVPASLQADRQAALDAGISPSEGGEAFARIVALRLPQVVVSSRLESLRAPVPASRPRATAPEGAGEAADRTHHPRPDLPTPYRAPATALERQLAGVWEALLGVTGIGVDDHFFDLGGDSLLATQLISRLRADFDLSLSLKDVLDRPTVARLAAAADAAGEQARLLAEIEGLSDEEAEARLRELMRPPDA